MRTWLLWSTSVLLAAATEDHGRTVVQAFFAPEGIADKRAVYTGEMLEALDKPTMGVYWGPAVRKEYRLLQASETSAVHAVRASAPDGSTQDWYIFVRQSGGTWRLEAVRTLALTGTLGGLVEALQNKPNRSAEEEWRYRNAELTLSSDDKLKALLIKRRAALTSLLPLVAAGKQQEAAVRSALRELHFSLARQTPEGHVMFVIGGILDNTVGFLYVPEGIGPPPMTPSEFIYVEQVEGRWYVFKTT